MATFYSILSTLIILLLVCIVLIVIPEIIANSIVRYKCKKSMYNPYMEDKNRKKARYKKSKKIRYD